MKHLQLKDTEVLKLPTLAEFHNIKTCLKTLYFMSIEQTGYHSIQFIATKGFFPVAMLSNPNNETSCCSSVSLYSAIGFKPHCSYAASSLILCIFFIHQSDLVIFCRLFYIAQQHSTNSSFYSIFGKWTAAHLKRLSSKVNMNSCSMKVFRNDFSKHPAP